MTPLFLQLETHNFMPTLLSSTQLQTQHHTFSLLAAACIFLFQRCPSMLFHQTTWYILYKIHWQLCPTTFQRKIGDGKTFLKLFGIHPTWLFF